MNKIVLILLLIIGSLNAENITNSEQKFSALCIEDAATGFKWKNGNWKEVTYFPRKYLYKKIKSPDKYCKNTKIEISDYDKNQEYKRIVFSKGCYEVGEFGSKFRIERECDELWYLHPNGDTELYFVRCHGVEFQPDGMFTKSSHHTQFNDYKINGKEHRDSLIVSYGKCSKI